MLVRIKLTLLGLLVGVVMGLTADTGMAQSTSPATLAAKQHIKQEVVRAMADGNISPEERQDILADAKPILNRQEYDGLMRTMDRLSPPRNSVSHAGRYDALPGDSQGILSGVNQIEKQIPYVEKIKSPNPEDRKITLRPVYFERPDWNFAAGADKMVSKMPSWSQIYIEQPTFAKIFGKTPPTARAASSSGVSQPSAVEKNAAENQGKKNIYAQTAPQRPSADKRVKNSIGNKPAVNQSSATSDKTGDISTLSSTHVDYSIPTLTAPDDALLPDQHHTAVATAAFNQSMTADSASKSSEK
jgi:hypothetical protein